MRKRWKQHWAHQEAELKTRERQVDRRTEEFIREQQRLESQRKELYQGRLRLNGERELARCEQREQWQQLRQAQHDWQAEREKMATAQAAQQVRLDERSRAIQALEREFASQL
jgi:hypothetical protein